MSEPTSVVPFHPSRQAALDALEAAMERLTQYRDSSLDRGPGDRGNLTQLGAYLSGGLLRSEEVVAASFERFKPAELLRFMEALTHHTYTRAWLETRSQVYAGWRRTVIDELRTAMDNPAYRKAIEGQTVVPAFNVWVEELRQTGYLHHQSRRAFASIWLFTLKLPWSLGADFFARYLLDINHASNLFHWRTVAGLQGGNPYLVSGKTIAKQTCGRLEAEQPLARDARPLRGPQPPGGLLNPYPQRPSEKLGSSYALLVTGEDLVPETGVLSELSPSCVIVIPTEQIDHGWEVRVSEFRTRALEEAGQRVAGRFGCPLKPLRWEEDGAAALAELAAQQSFESLVYYEPYVGPWKDALAQLTGRDVGVRFFPLRRRWDAKLFGLASRGFVQFWKQARPKLQALSSGS